MYAEVATMSDRGVKASEKRLRSLVGSMRRNIASATEKQNRVIKGFTEEVDRLEALLEESAAPNYYLSPKAAAGLLRRAAKRGRTLPAALTAALEATAAKSNNEPLSPPRKHFRGKAWHLRKKYLTPNDPVRPRLSQK